MGKSDFNFVDGLQLLFIGLKLSGNIDWSWWLVFAPVITVLSLTVIVTIVKGAR